MRKSVLYAQVPDVALGAIIADLGTHLYQNGDQMQLLVKRQCAFSFVGRLMYDAKITKRNVHCRFNDEWCCPGGCGATSKAMSTLNDGTDKVSGRGEMFTRDSTSPLAGSIHSPINRG